MWYRGSPVRIRLATQSPALAGLSFFMFRLIQLLLYYWHARTAYSMHSPMLYSFCRQVLDDTRTFYAFIEMELWRKKLLVNQTEIQRVDLGAGNTNQSGGALTISHIAQTSLSQPWKCRYLFRIVLWWKPDLILELGTSLGVSAGYLASADKRCPLITLDGDPSFHQQARHGWQIFGLDHIQSQNCAFEDGLNNITWKDTRRLLVFLDGDHRPEKVEAILDHIYLRATKPFIVILDDIRWSPAMWAGWQRWQKKWSVGAWLDLFQGGIWICDPIFREVQYQTLIPSRFKPLRTGWI